MDDKKQLNKTAITSALSGIILTIGSFPLEEIKAEKWNIHVDKNHFISDLKTVANDILNGKANSLFQHC